MELLIHGVQMNYHSTQIEPLGFNYDFSPVDTDEWHDNKPLDLLVCNQQICQLQGGIPSRNSKLANFDKHSEIEITIANSF